MAHINSVWPELPWPYLVERGVLSPQFEAGDVSKQLSLTAGEDASLSLMVDNASKYGNSTWYRALGRLTAPGDQRFGPGTTVGVAKRLMFPAGTVLEGATVIDEAHGPGGVVAPVRLLTRPDERLYVAFNGGSRTASGFTGWSPEIPVADFPFGVEHELGFEIRFSTSSASGRLRVELDGEVVFDEARATSQLISGAYQFPYMLSGIYVGSATVPVVCLLRRVEVWDTLREARAAFRSPARFPFALVVKPGTDDSVLVAEFMDWDAAERARTDELKDPALAGTLSGTEWFAEEERAVESRLAKGLPPRPDPAPVPVKDLAAVRIRG